MAPMQTIKVEIAPGELIDKITILEIKTERITDPAKVRNVAGPSSRCAVFAPCWASSDTVRKSTYKIKISTRKTTDLKRPPL